MEERKKKRNMKETLVRKLKKQEFLSDTHIQHKYENMQIGNTKQKLKKNIKKMVTKCLIKNRERQKMIKRPFLSCQSSVTY